VYSIIVPVYNGGKFIDQFFAAFVKADCEAVKELIFVDNNSTDGSLGFVA